MENVLIPPAEYVWGFIPLWTVSLIIPVLGIAVFTYIVALRMAPMVRARSDARTNNPVKRLVQLAKVWLLQWRQPRYPLAGVLHILLFAGFLVLSIRSTSMVVIGLSSDFVMPGFEGALGRVYTILKDYAATWVFIAVAVAAWRRGIVKPARYAVPERYGKDHTAEALLVLGFIATLMVSESLFDASRLAAGAAAGHSAPLTLAWAFEHLLSGTRMETLQKVHIASYFVHDVTFFVFLCFLPLGKHFHVITSLFNVYFMRLSPGVVKPVLYGVSDEELDDLESFGVKKLEDFTWKHVLDFYSCADCGRCSDNCPANAVGRPLSPRFISVKGRELAFKNYPVYPYGAPFRRSEPLIGTTYSEDEIWSCTTCGACERECPLGIEYIDKIVDLRRGMVDEGNVPQSLQKPLSALEKRGNPWGKMEKKRADWTKDMPEDAPVTVLNGDKGNADTLYFVDSITSYDDRMQSVARATAGILGRAGARFGILGKNEKDSGNEARRFGEEMLFQDLRDRNTEAILGTGVSTIVTADPHALNALKNDYTGLPPVEHITQFAARMVESGDLRFTASENGGKAYVFHDPCYLGRHNGVYDAPRTVLDAMPGMRRVEMQRSRDRSFCCGGGGLMLFYEPEEEERMGVLRVRMAVEAGADVIVTACPFCLVNMEDAIKVAGLEGKMEAIDFSELVFSRMA